MDRILSIGAHTCFRAAGDPFVVIYRGEVHGPVTTNHHFHSLTAASYKRLVNALSCRGSLRLRKDGFVWDRRAEV